MEAELGHRVDLPNPAYITQQRVDGASDAYIEGYIQSLIDLHYYEHRVQVVVRSGHVFLFNAPKNQLIADSIVAFVRDLPGVLSVQTCDQPQTVQRPDVPCAFIQGVWFPQITKLFYPFLAEPRPILSSITTRLRDNIVGRTAINISIGDEFAVFRWRDVAGGIGDIEIGITACVWAIFNFTNVPPHVSSETSELVNTDYLLGIPLSFASGRWSWRLHIYHISAHLGDELLVNHPLLLGMRTNISIETLEFVAAYQMSDRLRLYAGPGGIFRLDKSQPFKALYILYGGEAHFCSKSMFHHGLHEAAFFAVHISHWQTRHWNSDLTARLGYEISKLQGVGRKMRIFGGYHHGFSPELSFFESKTKYWEFGLTWGF